MLAFLLVKNNINTILIERATTVKREFRGESISPDSVAILERHNIMHYIESHGYIETKKMQNIVYETYWAESCFGSGVEDR